MKNEKTENSEGKIESSGRKSKKRKNPAAVFFKAVFFLILVFLIILSLWCAFSVFDRKSSLSAIPRNYTAYVHSDSAFDTLNPLLDLQAADVFLSMPEFSKFRKAFMAARSSPLRENKFVIFALSRPVDFAFYKFLF